ncbi:anti-sigma regulatory factor (Ser/Thr protein kinase) [Streptacidiphilus sp. EB103A]
MPGLLPHDALLTVSELVSNAVRHAPGPCTVDLLFSGHRLVIAVTDTSPQVPVRRDPDPATGAGGFGIHLLGHVAADITARAHRQGRTVIVSLATPRP